MPAYLIADSEVTDPAKYEEYKKLTPGAIAAYGGRFIVRGGSPVALEGDWSPKRVVIIEFASVAAARTFYESPEYRIAREVRAGAANMKLLLVEGV
jgi:uncharacterized protein (DUF1330 family)